MVNLQVIVRTESMPTIRMPTTLYSKYVLLISKDAYYTISMCYLTVRMADIVKNTPPKIHLAVWGGGRILHKRIFAQLKNPPPKIYICTDKYKQTNKQNKSVLIDPHFLKTFGAMMIIGKKAFVLQELHDVAMLPKMIGPRCCIVADRYDENVDRSRSFVVFDKYRVKIHDF